MVLFAGYLQNNHLLSHETTAVNLEGLKQLSKDIDALAAEADRLAGQSTAEIWAEARQTVSIPLNDAVTEFVQPGTRQQNYSVAEPIKV